MTVSELRKLLNVLPGDMNVVIADSDSGDVFSGAFEIFMCENDAGENDLEINIGGCRE